MREQGGGTLFSQMIERPKLSVKVPASATESNESKRRLSNGGGVYASYGAGAKSMGSILPPAAVQANMQQRLKGGTGGAMALVQGQRQSYSSTELHDLSAVERLKELRARLEPLLKQKAASLPSAPAVSAAPPPPPPPPPPEDSVAPPLPQWGLGKRVRRSRCDALKLNGAAFPAKALPLRDADEAASPPHTHGWSKSTPAFMESDGHSSKGASAVARNGIISRNGVSSVRQGFTGVERALGSGGLTYKAEPSILLRQRNDTAEVPIATNGSNGHAIGGVTHVSRATAASEIAAASASFHAKPRSELQGALEWPRILIGLSRKEKEDDFLILKGAKLPQRPKKRPKVVERALHFCTPGNALCDLSRGRYDVREKKSMKKRPRGLKAMESMESDSE